MWRKIIIIVLGVPLSTFVASGIFAQDTSETTETPTEVPTEMPTEIPTTTPTEIPQIIVTGLQPTTFTHGIGGTLTINGANFVGQTEVLLSGSIELPLTSQSSDTLVASVGSDVPAGSYTVEVANSNGSTAAIGVTVIKPTAIPQLIVTQTEPSHITVGQSGNLSIIGLNFTSSTTVRLIDYGFLTDIFINSGAVTATLPGNIPTGNMKLRSAIRPMAWRQRRIP